MKHKGEITSVTQFTRKQRLTATISYQKIIEEFKYSFGYLMNKLKQKRIFQGNPDRLQRL